MGEKNLLTRFWVQAAFFFLWWILAFVHFGEFGLAFLYLLLILTFAAINGIVGTKRSFLYTVAPVVYIALTSFVLPLMAKLNNPFVEAIYGGLLGGILLSATIGPGIGIHNALSINAGGHDFWNPVTTEQFLIFVVLQAGAFGLGYLWKIYSGKKYMIKER